MKQKLQKQKGRLMSSLLPQKWLMSLLTLMLFCIGSGSAWAEEGEIWQKLDFNEMGKYTTADLPYTLQDLNLINSFRIDSDNANKPNISNIGIPGINGITTSVYVQNASGWQLQKDGDVTYLVQTINNASRWLVVQNCKQGQRLEIEGTNNDFLEDARNMTGSASGNKYTYTVDASGWVAVKVKKSSKIKSIALYGTIYTVTFSSAGGWGVASGVTVKNLTTNEEVTSTDKNTSTMKVLPGTTIRVSASQLGGESTLENRLLLKKWTINGADDFTGITRGGIAYVNSTFSFDKVVDRDLTIVANYGQAWTIKAGDAVNGSAKVVYNEAEQPFYVRYTEPTTVQLVATPNRKYVLDKWVLKRGDWSKDMPADNPLNVTLEQYGGDIQGNGDGFDVVVTPVFKENDINVPEPADDSTIGSSNKDKGWAANNGEGAYSKTYNLEKGHEYTFEFDCNAGSAPRYQNWVLVGCNGDLNDTKFILRPDIFVYDVDTNKDGNITGADKGRQNPTIALKDAAFDWATFDNDISQGVHVTIKVAYDGNNVFVYEVIQRGDHKYTYYYPYSYAAESIDLRVAVDKSQLTNFTATVKSAYKVTTVVRDMNNVPNNDMGRLVMTNTEGVTILEGSLVGVGTEITYTAIPNAGYMFDHWANKEVHNPRTFTMEARDVEMYANFASLSDYEKVWSLNAKWVGTLYYGVGDKTWERNDKNNFFSNNMPEEVTYAGAYSDANKTEIPGYDGLLFSRNVRLSRYASDDAEVMLQSNGSMKVPVTRAGEIIVFTAHNDKSKDRILDIQGGNVDHVVTNGAYTTYYVIAADGSEFVQFDNHTDTNIRITSLKRTMLYDFTFADGTVVYAPVNTRDYKNPVVAPSEMLPLLPGATYFWSSSNPADVNVDPYTGVLYINQSFHDDVTITATRLPIDGSIYPKLSKSYVLRVTDQTLSFEQNEITIVLDENGAGKGWNRLKLGDEYAHNSEFTWSVVRVDDPNKKGSITQDDNGNGWYVNINGAGTYRVTAKSGALSASYIINTLGSSFDEAAPIYAFTGGEYTQVVTGATNPTYEIVDKIGNISKSSLWVEGATIKGLPTSITENKGGAVVVRAYYTDNDKVKNTYYTLTIPYEHYTWNFYREGLTTSDEMQTLDVDNKHFTLGQLVSSAPNPGAADDVKMKESVNGEIKGIDAQIDAINAAAKNEERSLTDAEKSQITALTSQYNTKVRAYLDEANGPTYEYIANKTGDEKVFYTHLGKRRAWKDLQNGNTDDTTKPYYYWNYTFKTLQYKEDRTTIYYANEPLFSYKNAVNGNNARIIKDTQGLIFNCGADCFGINDSSDKNAYDYDKSLEARETDRAILIRAGSSFTIPYVKENYYVKLHWYRHSDNAGDQFMVTNAKDLDGNNIDPRHRNRFTGSHYQGESTGYVGYTFLQAQHDGPMTITIAPNSWTEIYTIELTPKFETELKVICGDVEPNDDSAVTWAGSTCAHYDKQHYKNMDYEIVNVVRDSRNTDFLSKAELAENGYREYQMTTPVNNIAKLPSAPFGTNPLVYISSYPGNSYGWNGWNLDVTVEPVEADRGNLNIGTVMDLWTRIGNRLAYRMTALTNFRGTGTAHVVVRTKSGEVAYIDEATKEQIKSVPYTLDMQEAYFPVGEYHGQTYPYTWDFTNYNMESPKVYGDGKDERTYTYMSNSAHSDSYGAWKNTNSSSIKKIWTVANFDNSGSKYPGVDATIPALTSSNDKKYKKFLFADGSQFTVNGNVNYDSKPGAKELRETDGLRVTLGNMDLNHNYRTTDIHYYMNGTGIILADGGSITVPEVDQNMYIFVRSAQKPTKVEGAEDLNNTGKIESTNVTYSTFDNNVEVAFNQGDIPANVWIYKQSANTEKTDVVITPNGPIEGIGVTNYMKPMVQFKNMARATYTTDARAERIDYHNTGFFTNHDLKAYVANQNARMDSNDANSKDSENGTITLTEIKVIPKQGQPLDGSRGLMLEDVVAAPKAGAVNTARPLLPLFVPACNLQDESLVDNKFVGCITETPIPASTSTTRTYTLTNQYYDWDWANKTNVANPEHHVASDAAFYINRSNITSRKNSAYLSVSVPQQAGVKQIYMIFGEDDMEDATAIDGLEIATSEDVISQPVDVYTLTGVKLNGMPTQKGVYVINGKKVFVK